MRSTRSSRAVAVATLVVLSAVAGTAVAASVADPSVPDESRVGDVATASANVTDLYEGIDANEWTLVVETELEQPRWTIRYYNQTGGVVATTEVEGEQVLSDRTVAPPVDKVRVEVDGDTPEVESFEYGSNQTFLGLRIAQNVGGADDTIRAWQVTHFTDDSRPAREALDAAQAAIDEAAADGADVSEARAEFEDARQAYDSESFQLATDSADEARQLAEEAGQSAGGLPLLPVVGGLVVVVVLIGGGLYYYRQQQQKGSKLR
jgi:hypothetical protein